MHGDPASASPLRVLLEPSVPQSAEQAAHTHPCHTRCASSCTVSPVNPHSRLPESPSPRGCKKPWVSHASPVTGTQMPHPFPSSSISYRPVLQPRRETGRPALQRPWSFPTGALVSQLLSPASRGAEGHSTDRGSRPPSHDRGQPRHADDSPPGDGHLQVVAGEQQLVGELKHEAVRILLVFGVLLVRTPRGVEEEVAGNVVLPFWKAGDRNTG